MILGAYASSLSPGYEQFYRWDSQSKDVEGSFNYAGVANPAIDALLDKMLAVRGQEEFTSTVRALDRLLISGHYMIPIYYQPEQWVARWSHLQHPEKTSLVGNQLNTWWSDKR